MALYRRYRPATFAEVIGQEHVTEPLSRALRTNRIHHAFLFSGPRGCGKTSSARILARSLNCAAGPTPEPCGSCDSCLALAPDGPGSLDVVEIDAASYGGVEETRELRDRAAYGPVQSRCKVYVIDEAHMISKSGFNALLKLVEEPPPYLVFVFATTEPEKVIPTIRSRTFHYPFRLVPPTVLRTHLAKVAAAEGVAVDDGVLSLVVRAGGGSVRDSLSVLDQLVSGASEGRVQLADAVGLLGVTDEALLDEVVEALAAGDGATVFESVERVVDAGIDPRRFAADLLQRLRDLLLVLAVPDAFARGLIDAPADRLERLVDQAVRLGQATLSRHADTVHTGLVEMRGATSPRLVLELLCARLLLPEVTAPDGATLQRLERLERRIGVAGLEPAGNAAPTRVERVAPPAAPEQRGGTETRRPRRPEAPDGATPPPTAPAVVAPPPAAEGERPGTTPTAPKSPTAPPAGPTAALSPAAAAAPPPAGEELATVRRLWPEVLDDVKRRKRFAWMVLTDNATVLAAANGEITLGFRSSGSRIGFVNGGNEMLLREALIAVTGLALAVRCVDMPGPGGPPAGAATDRPDGTGGAWPAVTGAGPEPSDGDGEASSSDPVVDPAVAAEALVARGLGARRIGEWDNS